MTTPNTANPNPANPGGPNQTPAPGSPPLGQFFNPGQIASTVAQVTNAAAAGFLGEGINPAIQPSVLKTFVYSPEVRVVVAHNNIQYDVSADVVRCTLIRPENSAATFAVTLQNKDLRYSPENKPRFSRMDRIVVYMKKTGWNQVFSGYLDSIPYRQLYPGTVDLKATCTIKRLMHTWFNPDLPESSALLNQYSMPGVIDGNPAVPDSGLGELLRRVLILVGGWDATNIWIQNFPMGFMQFLQKAISGLQQANTPNAQTLTHLLVGSDTTPGPGAYAGHNPTAGTPGPSTPGVGGIPGAGAGAADTLTLFYVSQIVAACDEKGMGPLVSDNNLSAGLAEAGEVGASSGGPMQNPGQQKAWQTVQQTNLDAQQANRNSDAAILGTAAAMALTGAGAGIRNLCNVAVPGSDQFPNDGPGLSGSTGVGIFALVNAAEWGDLAQRMNPKQAAGMFMAHVAALTGGNWRNMDPAAACQQALRTSTPAPFSATIQQATTLVQAYRTGSSGTSSTTAVMGNSTIATGSSATSVASTLSGAGPGSNPNLVAAVASNTPNPVINPGVTNPARAGKPEPDSEGAINWATTQMGRPFEWGGTGPLSYDAAGLISQAFKAIGVFVPSRTDAIRGGVTRILPNTAVQRGDIVEPSSGHAVIWCGDGTIIEASQMGGAGVVQRVPSWIGDPANWTFVGRACMNGGVDPTAPFNPPETMGPGSPPGALDQSGGTGVGSGGVQDAGSRNLFSYWFTDQFTSEKAQLFRGHKAFMTGAPLIQMVQQICSAGLRSWSSAPNGDFMAWYPDYWGLDGKPCVLRLEDIELTDVHIDFTDDALTTHVYVAGDTTMVGMQDPIMQWVESNGVVTCEGFDTWLYQRLIQIAPPDENLSGDLLIKRYGIRPLKKEFLMAGDHDLEFLLATKVFMEKWAEQYKTTISMTFMPELFPGMRVELAGHNLQVYVTEVTHVCDYEQGFYTTAAIMAPSVPMAKKGMETVKTVIGPSQYAMAFAEGGPSDWGSADPGAGGDVL